MVICVVTFLPHKKLTHYGQGFYLWIYEDGRKYWRLRYKIHPTTGRINKQKAKQAAVDSFEAIAREWYEVVPQNWTGC